MTRKQVMLFAFPLMEAIVVTFISHLVDDLS